MGVIHDGYTFSGRISGGAMTLRFRYRPMLSPERREFLTAFHGWADWEALGPVCDWMRRHISDLSCAMPLEQLYDEDRALFAALRAAIVGVVGPDGEPWGNWEADDVQNLRDGVRLEILNPGLARRTCEECQTFLYDEDTGRRIQRAGLDVLRPPEMQPACRQRDGCPLGTPESPRRMSPRNKAALKHFRECDAVHSFPDDPIVRRNAQVIRAAIRSAERELEHERRSDPGGYDGARGGPVAPHGRTARRAVRPAAESPIWSPFGPL